MAVYRLILAGTNRYDTGATYPGCTIDNQQACDPVAFDTLEDAVDYAYAHGELPVMVFSEQEAWNIAAGAVVDQSRVLPPVVTHEMPISWTWVLVGVGVLFLLTRGSHSSAA